MSGNDNFNIQLDIILLLFEYYGEWLNFTDNII